MPEPEPEDKSVGVIEKLTDNIIALSVIWVALIMALLGMPIPEWLKVLIGAVSGFYFGTKAAQ